MKIEKIVIIDDDMEYINEMSEILIQNKYIIIKKNNTDDILNFIKFQKPDLIIIDLKINGMSGIDVAKLVKNDPKTNGLPIILLTNYYDENKEFNIFTLGIKVCLKKTISPEVLINEIDKIKVTG